MNKTMKTGFGKAKRYYQGGLAKASTSLPVPEKGTGLKKETFKEAFRRARDRNAPDFEYNGEKFTTEYKEEKDAREAKEKAKKSAEKPSHSVAKVEKTKDTPAKLEKLRDKDFDEISGRGAVMVSPTRSVAIERKEKAGSTTRTEPSLARIANPTLRGGGGGGGTSAASRRLQLGSELDPKELMRSNSSPRGRNKARFNDDVAEFKKGGEVKKTTASRGNGCAIRGKTKGRIY